MTRTVFLNFFYGLLYHLTKKQPPLSTSQIMGAVLIVFSRGHYVIIAPELRNVLVTNLIPKLTVDQLKKWYVAVSK